MGGAANWVEFGRAAKIASLFVLTLFFYLLGFELTPDGRSAVVGREGTLLKRVEGFRYAVPQLRKVIKTQDAMDKIEKDEVVSPGTRASKCSA